MKTMTCTQLGGPCEVEHHGKDHNEVIKAQDRHLKAQVAAGDATHREAHEAMRSRWKRPVSGLGWYREVKREFASLPDDDAQAARRGSPPGGRCGPRDPHPANHPMRRRRRHADFPCARAAPPGLLLEATSASSANVAVGYRLSR